MFRLRLGPSLSVVLEVMYGVGVLNCLSNKFGCLHAEHLADGGYKALLLNEQVKSAQCGASRFLYGNTLP